MKLPVTIRQRYAGVRVAVLGATGFVGRWVARYLTEAEADVWLVARATRECSDLSEAMGIRGDCVRGDVTRPDALIELLASIRPAVTFNLIGYGVDPAEREPDLAELVNAEWPARLGAGLAAFRDPVWSGACVVHVGSALEYGNVRGDLVEDGEERPDTLYGITKRRGSHALADLCRHEGLRGLTARLFTVYGPGEHEGRLLPSLLEASRTGKALPLTAGDQERDFTYVEDVAEGLLRLGMAQVPPGGIVNLATGQLATVRAFVETAATVLGIPSASLEFGALQDRPSEMRHAPVNLGRLRGLTGWAPATSIEEGVGRTAARTVADTQQGGPLE